MRVYRISDGRRTLLLDPQPRVTYPMAIACDPGSGLVVVAHANAHAQMLTSFRWKLSDCGGWRLQQECHVLGWPDDHTTIPPT